MSFLGIGGGGNLFSSIANFAIQGALGVATGGASLMVTTALKGFMMAVGDQVLQNIGQKLGLPQPIIDMAQAAFHSAAGDPGGAVQNLSEAAGGLAGSVGGGNFEAGELQRQGFDAANWLQEQVLDRLQGGVDEEGQQTGGAKAKQAAAKGGASGESFLMKLALAMGKTIDKKMDEMLKTAKEIDGAKSAGDDSQITQLSAKMTALGQEVSIMTNALNTSLKSLGEASSTLARKQ